MRRSADDFTSLPSTCALPSTGSVSNRTSVGTSLMNERSIQTAIGILQALNKKMDMLADVRTHIGGGHLQTLPLSDEHVQNLLATLQ